MWCGGILSTHWWKRQKYRGLLRRRLTPVRVGEGALAEEGQILQEGRDVGNLRAVREGYGLAMLKLEALESDAPLMCGAAALVPSRPGWWRDQSQQAAE